MPSAIPAMPVRAEMMSCTSKLTHRRVNNPRVGHLERADAERLSSLQPLIPDVLRYEGVDGVLDVALGAAAGADNHAGATDVAALEAAASEIRRELRSGRRLLDGSERVRVATAQEHDGQDPDEHDEHADDQDENDVALILLAPGRRLPTRRCGGMVRTASGLRNIDGLPVAGDELEAVHVTVGRVISHDVPLISCEYSHVNGVNLLVCHARDTCSP